MSLTVGISSIARLPKDYQVPDKLARDLRRADHYIQMAVISAFSAVSGLSTDNLDPEEIGVFIGTAFGPLETNFESLGSLIDDGEGQISPTLFSHSVYNAAAGYVARLLNIRGPAVTITNYGWPFLIALEEARLAVATERISRAIVVGVETYSDLLGDAYCRFFNAETVPWERGATAWILEPEKTHPAYCSLLEVKIREFEADPADLLTRNKESLIVGKEEVKLARQPMAYVDALSSSVESIDLLPGGELTMFLEAPFGRAKIKLSGKGV